MADYRLSEELETEEIATRLIDRGESMYALRQCSPWGPFFLTVRPDAIAA